MKFIIEKLPHPEHSGDWHDAPLRWIARATDVIFTQKFSTKRHAEIWRRCVRQSGGDWKRASDAYMAS